MSYQLEREEELIEQEYNEGHLSLKEYNDAMRDLHRDYRAAAEEAAMDAYRRELENW